jgi:hypothetical protein
MHRKVISGQTNRGEQYSVVIFSLRAFADEKTRTFGRAGRGGKAASRSQREMSLGGGWKLL